MKDEKLRERNLQLLEMFFADSDFKNFSFKLWDGTEWKPKEPENLYLQ